MDSEISSHPAKQADTESVINNNQKITKSSSDLLSTETEQSAIDEKLLKAESLMNKADTELNVAQATKTTGHLSVGYDMVNDIAQQLKRIWTLLPQV